MKSSKINAENKVEDADIIIDVGANKGEFSFAIASRNPNIHVLAIEPILELSNDIQNRALKENIKNIEVLNIAIDNIEKKADFYVADHADLGVSSLLTFDSDLINKDPYWRKRSDLYFDRTIQVNVLRLDSLLNKRNIHRIRFIKIDAQGVDLNVLESLGEYLKITDAGMLEIPATLKTKLYQGENYDLTSAFYFLNQYNFKIYCIKPNDHAANEYNVFFCKSGLEPDEIEENLKLNGIQLYDGKHFWHLPSNKWEPYDIKLKELEDFKTKSVLEIQQLHKELEKSKIKIAEQEKLINMITNSFILRIYRSFISKIAYFRR